MTPYEEEINRNAEVWKSKALLRDVYFQMYSRIAAWIDPFIAGKIIEIGSGIGNFGEFRPGVILTDQSIQRIDLTCNAYRLPFAPRTLAHRDVRCVPSPLRAAGIFESARARESWTDHHLRALHRPLVIGCVRRLSDEPIAWREDRGHSIH